MANSSETPSAMLVAQRVRNRIIEYWQTASSFEAQLEYEAAVPIVHVPKEMINEWEDWVQSDHPEWYVEPVYSLAEQVAIRDFHTVWQSVLNDTPDTLPPLSDLIGTEPWERLRAGAERALTVFDLRGKFDEECEVFS